MSTFDATIEQSILPVTLLPQNYLIPLLAIIVIAIVLVLLRSRMRLPKSRKAEMIAALRAGEFVVHYQPLIDLRTGKCIGAEALLRWQCANGNMISPELFIPEAEQNGAIGLLTDHVLTASLSDLANELRSRPQFHIAFNISAPDIQSGRILTVLEKLLTRYAIAPGQIWLEATESGIRNLDAMQVTLSRAREWGCRIAIDDFGTGYSSLSCLEGLPLDILKIDKSFVSGPAGRSRIVGHIIAMAESLQLNIVAEGIETTDQAKWLCDNGVDFGQGWLYAKAMSAADLKKYLEKMDGHLPVISDAIACSA